jgi:ubiquitin-like modifier-activating enzyme ATG7
MAEGALKFVPFTTSISVSFWTCLARKKLNDWKLDDAELGIWGYYEAGTRNRPTRFHITEDCLESDAKQIGSTISVRMNGTLKLFNTVEDFKNVNKTQIMEEIKSSKGDCFVMVAFADLKKHKYYYHVLYPAFFDPQIIPTWTDSALPEDVDLKDIRRLAMEKGAPWFKRDGDSFFVFVDPGPMIDGVLGWPARSLIFSKGQNQPEMDILCIGQGIADAKMVHVKTGIIGKDSFAVTGWEKNESGVVGPTVVNLAPMMDPKRLAKEASDLNLRLIKWRLLPELDLEKFKTAKCLLFGAGTLGCNVTRILLGWGFQNITLIDNGKVSFSNPPRQSLFRFEDCLDGGKPKAETAAMRALEIDPSAVKS